MYVNYTSMRLIEELSHRHNKTTAWEYWDVNKSVRKSDLLVGFHKTLGIALNANLMKLEILFEVWNFHLATNLLTKEVFNHVMRKWNLAGDWLLHPDNIALSTKHFCEVEIRKIRGQEQFFLQEKTPGF